MRQFLSIAIPIMTPMALYMAWISIAQWRAPWTMLAVAGVALLALTLGATALLTGDDPDTAYRPPRVIDGQIVPGGTARP
jgi:hypothetical protein